MCSLLNTVSYTDANDNKSLAEAKSILFPVSSTVGEVDKLVNRFFVENSVSIPSLILDLSNSKFIEIAALVLILSLASNRRKKRLDTFLNLPNDKNARDFLRQWKFPKAYSEVVGLPFIEGVTPDSAKYFGENPNPNEQKYTGNLYFVDGRWEERLTDQYFSFNTFNASDVGSAFALDEAGRWNRQVIASVLKKHLSGPERYFPSRIIFEALMNGGRHPAANKIQMASHISSTKESGFFTLVIWDDGESIIDTLRTALLEGKEIRSQSASEFDKVYYSVKLCQDHCNSDNQLDSTYVPKVDDPDYLFLAAATLPGITRDALGLKHVTHPELASDNPRLRQPGMGLYLLINAAVGIYNGTVSFRTKEYFMNIKQETSSYRDRYRAKIIQYSSDFSFSGNLLTVRLPLGGLRNNA